MDNSYNIIRRFTPPTCTLEIWGKNSSLSRWTKKTVVKNIKFKLSFDDPRNLDAEPLIIEGDRNKLEQLYDTVLTYTGNFLANSFTSKKLTYNATDKKIADSQLNLTTQSLVNHQLNLGNLATDKTFSAIDLSVTQLFDLVSALEEYKTEISALNQLEAKKNKSQKIIPIGLSVAGILLAVGITTAGIKIANRTEKEQISAKQNTESQINNDSILENVVPPEVSEKAEKPVVITKENNPLSSSEKLPPPPPVDSPKPPPNIPDPAKYPPLGNLTIPPISSAPIQTPDRNNSAIQSPKDSSQVESNIAVSPEISQSEVSENRENVEKTEIVINGQNSPIENDRSNDTSLNEQTILEEETNIALENAAPKPSIENTNITENQTESKIPENIQLQEVKSYFNQKWQSPSELKQTLEYRLIINKDGSIKRIIPIGKASEIYLDRTNIPLMGEPFVSSLQNSESATIRLLLSPDGEVRTFLE